MKLKLAANLFDFERAETPGEVLFFKGFELFVAVFTAYLAWTWGLYILRISDVVLPLGIAYYVDVSFMFGNVLPLVNAGVISALALLGFFRVTRYAYFIAFLLLHLQYAARYSLGEIPHSANMFGMTLLGLGLAMLLFRESRYRRRFTLGFAYFYIGLGYTLAAFSKLVGSGLGWSDGRHLWMWIYEKSIDAFAKTGVLDYNLLQRLLLSDHGIATVFLTVGLLTEFFAFLMWWRRLRTPTILAVIALHFGIFFVMNIMFTLSVVELVLLAFPWAAWLDHGLERAGDTAWLRRIHGVSLRFA